MSTAEKIFHCSVCNEVIPPERWANTKGTIRNCSIACSIIRGFRKYVIFCSICIVGALAIFTLQETEVIKTTNMAAYMFSMLGLSSFSFMAFISGILAILSLVLRIRRKKAKSE